MEINNNILKLKTSLCDAIQKWIHSEEASGSDGWEELDTYFGDCIAELMADSAFNILLAQSDLTKYLKREKPTDL